MDENDISELTKDFLKKMPIWEHVETMGVEITKKRYEVDNLSRRIKDMEDRCDKEQAILNGLNDLGINVKSPNNPSETSKATNGQQPPSNVPSEVANTQYVDSDYSTSLKMLRQRVKSTQEVFAMIDADKPWVKCKLMFVFRRPLHNRPHPVTTFRLRLPPDYTDIKDIDQLAAAWTQCHGLGLRPTKRVIAGVNDENLLAGMIGNVPNERTKNRYLVHFDNGSAGYFSSNQVYPIVYQSSKPWKDPKILGTDERSELIHNTYNIIRYYPRRYFIDVKVGSSIYLERDGKTLPAEVLELDTDILRLKYKDNYEECIYRGSSRLLRKQGEVSKQLLNSNNIDHFHPSIIFYMNDYQIASRMALGYEDDRDSFTKSRTTARKSTASRARAEPNLVVQMNDDHVHDSRNVQDLSKLESEESKLHKCDPNCLNIDGVRTESSVEDIIAEFRNMSDLKVPLVLGWKRMLCNIPFPRGVTRVCIVYKSPCGKYFKQPYQVKKHLYTVRSKLDIDYFTFDRQVELNTLIEPFKAYYFEENIAKSKDGKCLENKHLSLINQFDHERIPLDFEYFNETIAHPNLAAKGFSFNPEFKSSCDCDSDCYQRASCSCHILNEEFSGQNSHLRGNISTTKQYKDKRLPTQVGTGIFECNSGCSCSSKCGNRVVQNGIRFRLQLQKYPNKKGWGIVTLDDIPSGSFICTYTAELLDDADQYGDSDMYYADLDYITVNEGKKMGDSDDENSDEGVELEGGTKRKSPSEDEELESEDKYMPRQVKRYPSRQASRASVRSRGGQHRYRKIHDILRSHDFTLDARMRGNLGRFLNHSCDPNTFAQNVFIETHDLRFPNVAFFAQKTIKALEEITWDYNYKMGTIDGRKIICLCAKSNCRGRIL